MVTRFVEKGNGEMRPSQPLSLPHPLPPMCMPATETAVRSPVPVSDATGAYTWRIDLSKTEPFWRGWFSNMSSLFLSVPEPKLLLVAGVDRLDKELTIAQMQGEELPFFFCSASKCLFPIGLELYSTFHHSNSL